MRLLHILILILGICPFTLGLKCHSCFHSKGKSEGAEKSRVFTGNEKCWDNPTIFTLKNCDTDADAQNSRTIVSAKWISSSANYTLGCLNAVIAFEDGNMLFRGCYGLPDEQFGSYYGKCESAEPRLWEKVSGRSVELGTKEALHISKSKLNICFCGDADGCNSAKNLHPNIHLGVMLLFVCLFVKSTETWRIFSF